MAKNSPKTAAAEGGSTIAPLFALCKIGFNVDDFAEAHTIFSPADEDQRAELIAMGAARDLTEAEAALAEKQGFGVVEAATKEAEVPAPPAAPASGADGETFG